MNERQTVLLLVLDKNLLFIYESFRQEEVTTVFITYFVYLSLRDKKKKLGDKNNRK